MDQKGIIPLLPLVVVGLLAMGGFVYTVRTSQQQIPTVTLNPTSAPSSSIVASPSASIAPSPSASPTPSPSPTFKPVPTVSPIPPAPKPVSGSNGVATDKGTFAATVYTFDMNSTRMVTDTGNDGECGNDCTVMSLKDYVTRNNGFAGVNGTYFCPDTYPDCASKKNSYDFPVYNSRLSRWINQGNLFWNDRAMIYFDGTGAHYMQNARDFNGSLTAGIVNYPGLVNDGNVQIDDNQSGLSDKQKARGFKMGLGVKDNRTMILVMSNAVTMNEFAHVFKALGAKGALNLDNGGSSAFYMNGSYIIGPGRAIPNAVIFVR